MTGSGGTQTLETCLGEAEILNRLLVAVLATGAATWKGYDNNNDEMMQACSRRMI
jgi:hypothetical protein